MQIIVHKLPLAAVIVSATLLAGCSGSSDSITPSSTTSLSGTAAKGIIKQAKVTAEELVGTTWTLRGEATTDNNGDYTLTMSGYTNGVVRVTVTPTASTRMVCDAPSGCISADGSTTPFGSDATLATDFSMKSVVPPVTTADNKAYVTPLTDMVAANLEQNPTGINSDTIKQKSSQVAATFGLGDILRTRPIDITKGIAGQDQSEQNYALALSVVAEMVKQSSTNAAGTTQALAKLRNSFLDGKFDSTDSFSGNKDVLTSILETKTAVLNNNVISGKIDAQVKTIILNDTADKQTSYKPAEGYTPPVVETAVANDIDKAKAIVAQARALQSSISSMESPAQSFTNQIDTVSKVWNDRSSLLSLYLTEIIQDVGGQLGNSIKGAVTDQVVNLNTTQGMSCYPDAQSTLKTNVYDYNTQTSSVQNASCYVYNGYYSPKFTPTNMSIGSVKVSVADSANGLLITVTKALPPSGDTLPATNLTFTLPNFTVADLAANSKTLSGASMIINGTISDTRANMTIDNLTASTNFINAYTASDNSTTQPILASATLKGAIRFTDNQTNASFVGNADMVAVRPSMATNSENDKLSLSKISLDGTFSNASNSVKAAATFNLTNAASFDLTAFSNYEKQKYVNADSYFGDTALPSNLNNLTILATAAGMPGNATVNNVNYSANSYSYTNNVWTPIVNQTCFSYQIPTTSYYQSYNYSTQQYEQVPYTSYSYSQTCSTGDVLDFASMLTQKTTGAISTQLTYAGYSPKTEYYSGYAYASGVATFPDFESANNFAQGNLTLSLDANLAGFPNTVATVTVDRQGYPDIGTAVVSLKQQSVNRGLTISASNSVANGASSINALTVTSLDGTTMTLNKSATGGIQGTIKVGNTTVADIIDMKGWTKVSFKDDTFESF